ncbi:unnamed protein product, partial [Brenthis ino]
MNAQLLIIFGLLLTTQICLSTSDGIEEKTTESSVTPAIKRSSHHHYETPNFQGFWKKKLIWRPRWVKTWQEKKIYVAVWKRMWGPAVVKEWVPVPKPPPGWIKSDPGAYFVKVGVPH